MTARNRRVTKRSYFSYCSYYSYFLSCRYKKGCAESTAFQSDSDYLRDFVFLVLAFALAFDTVGASGAEEKE